MKLARILLLSILWLLGGYQVADAQERVALLAGIGDYGVQGTSLPALQAATGLRLMERTLLEKGFLKENILILKDGAATKQAIENAFTTHLARAGKGGVAFFHFYGHGDRVRDDNGDEADGIDEIFLTHPQGTEGDEAAPAYIRDDELGRWVRGLQAQLGEGGQVVTILDACHSGSGLRGERSVETGRNALGDLRTADRPIASSVAFYSSRPDQASLEVRVDGAQRCALMTWAFCKAMTQMGMENTYRGLFERTLIHMTRKNRHQVPELEGDPDQLIFGAPIQPPPPYFRIVALLENDEVLLDGGALHGLTAGRTLVLHGPETRYPLETKPLATAEVLPEGATLTECRARLSKPIPESLLLTSWVFPERRKPESPTWAVHAASPIDGKILERISDHFQGIGTLQWCSREDAELMLIGRPDKMALRHPDGSPASGWIDPASDRGLAELAAYLDAYSKGQFLRGLHMKEAECNLDISSYSADGRGENRTVSPIRSGAKPVTRRSILSVRNTCQRAVYYTILDIDPLNRVRVIAPADGQLASEYRLQPGEENKPLEVSFDLPGTRFIKLIASPEPIDLRGMLATGSPAFSSTDLERLIDPELFWDAPSRGDTTPREPLHKVGVSTLVLEVR